MISRAISASGSLNKIGASESVTTATKRASPDKRISALRRFAVSITLLTVIGHLWLGFETPWVAPVIAVVTAYALELTFETFDAWASRRPVRYGGGMAQFISFLLSPHITGMAVALLIYPGERLWPFAFAAAVAVVSKYLFRATVDGKVRHFMNPSNLGISTTLVVFPYVGIAMPYQFTETVTAPLDIVIPLVLLASGLMMNLKLTGRRGIIIGWVGGFVVQAVLRWLFTGVALLGALSPITGVAFVLYTTYMITDPATTPNRERNQVIFGGAAAVCYGSLMVFHIVDGMFFALTLVCAARGLVLISTHYRKTRGSAPATARAPAVANGSVSANCTPSVIANGSAPTIRKTDPVEAVPDVRIDEA
jgi:enediyne biosynthesis protein E5